MGSCRDMTGDTTHVSHRRCATIIRHRRPRPLRRAGSHCDRRRHPGQWAGARCPRRRAMATRPGQVTNGTIVAHPQRRATTSVRHLHATLMSAARRRTVRRARARARYYYDRRAPVPPPRWKTRAERGPLITRPPASSLRRAARAATAALRRARREYSSTIAARRGLRTSWPTSLLLINDKTIERGNSEACWIRGVQGRSSHVCQGARLACSRELAR